MLARPAVLLVGREVRRLLFLLCPFDGFGFSLCVVQLLAFLRFGRGYGSALRASGGSGLGDCRFGESEIARSSRVAGASRGILVMLTLQGGSHRSCRISLRCSLDLPGLRLGQLVFLVFVQVRQQVAVSAVLGLWGAGIDKGRHARGRATSKRVPA